MCGATANSPAGQPRSLAPGGWSSQSCPVDRLVATWHNQAAHSQTRRKDKPRSCTGVRLHRHGAPHVRGGGEWRPMSHPTPSSAQRPADAQSRRVAVLGYCHDRVCHDCRRSTTRRKTAGSLSKTVSSTTTRCGSSPTTPAAARSSRTTPAEIRPKGSCSHGRQTCHSPHHRSAFFNDMYCMVNGSRFRKMTSPPTLGSWMLTTLITSRCTSAASA